MFFYITYDYITITITYDEYVTVLCFVIVMYDIILISNPKSKIRKRNKKEKENEKWNKNK